MLYKWRHSKPALVTTLVYNLPYYILLKRGYNRLNPKVNYNTTLDLDTPIQDYKHEQKHISVKQTQETLGYF